MIHKIHFPKQTEAEEADLQGSRERNFAYLQSRLQLENLVKQKNHIIIGNYSVRDEEEVFLIYVPD